MHFYTSNGQTFDVLKLIALVTDRKPKRLPLGRITGASRSQRTGFSNRRYQEADPKYPLLVIEDSNRLVDGRHRYWKLADLGRKTARIIRVTQQDLMRCLLSV